MSENYTGLKIISGPPGPKVTTILENSGLNPESYSSPIVKRARDVYVEDPDGNVFVDLISGRCVVNTGYNHPIVTRALREQIRDTIHGQTEEAYRLL